MQILACELVVPEFRDQCLQGRSPPEIEGPRCNSACYCSPSKDVGEVRPSESFRYCPGIYVYYLKAEDYHTLKDKICQEGEYTCETVQNQLDQDKNVPCGGSPGPPMYSDEL